MAHPSSISFCVGSGLLRVSIIGWLPTEWLPGQRWGRIVVRNRETVIVVFFRAEPSPVNPLHGFPTMVATNSLAHVSLPSTGSVARAGTLTNIRSSMSSFRSSSHILKQSRSIRPQPFVRCSNVTSLIALTGPSRSVSRVRLRLVVGLRGREQRDLSRRYSKDHLVPCDTVLQLN